MAPTSAGKQASPRLEAHVNIAMCLVGTRRGHAARAISVGSELLRRGHRVHFYTDRDAYELLSQQFGGTVCTYTAMPTYVEKNALIRPISTFVANLPFLLFRRRKSRNLIHTLHDFGPDMIVSDFEPLGSAAAKHYDCPLVSMNSQNFLGNVLLPRVSLSMRIQLLGIQFLTKALCPRPDLKVACKAFVRGKPGTNTLVVGPCIRPELSMKKREPRSGLLLAYLQDSQISDALELRSFCDQQGLVLKLYGPSKVPSALSDCYQTASVIEFSRDLRTCQALVCSAGSQLLGEAAYLGVPVLIRPEPNQAEQRLNAQLAARSVTSMIHDSGQQVDVSRLRALLKTADTTETQLEDSTFSVCDAVERLYYCSHRKTRSLIQPEKDSTIHVEYAEGSKTKNNPCEAPRVMQGSG